MVNTPILYKAGGIKDQLTPFLSKEEKKLIEVFVQFEIKIIYQENLH